MIDTVTNAAEECSIMSCAKSQKCFSGGCRLLIDSPQSLAVADCTGLEIYQCTEYYMLVSK